MDQKCALGRGGRCIRDDTHHQDIVVEPHIVPLFKPTGRDNPKLETVRKDEERRNDAIRENLWCHLISFIGRARQRAACEPGCDSSGLLHPENRSSIASAVP